MNESIPHPSNFCGGNFQDWLEVNLLPECNATCSWCIERMGYHPSFRASWEEIANVAIGTGKTNIILLGGEPTLYPDLSRVIKKLREAGRSVWLTTNGSRICNTFVFEKLQGLTGVNISIHHYEMESNREITGLLLSEERLKGGISTIHSLGGTVRLNCNSIRGYIDSEKEIHNYIAFAKRVGADNIRFAELKISEDFVNLTKVLKSKYGLNNNPFFHGCHQDAVIDGMQINFRQMCGLQTDKRPLPINPVQCAKEVLYYDGHIYPGWQSPMHLCEYAVDNILKDLSEHKISLDYAQKMLANI